MFWVKIVLMQWAGLRAPSLEVPRWEVGPVLIFFLLVFGSCRKHGAAGFSSTNQAFVTCTLFLKKNQVTCTLGNVSVVIVPSSAVWTADSSLCAEVSWCCCHVRLGKYPLPRRAEDKFHGVCTKKTRTSKSDLHEQVKLVHIS